MLHIFVEIDLTIMVPGYETIIVLYMYNWIHFSGLERCGKSCRLRWLNYLRPNIKRGNYTQEEDETIIKMVQRLGNRYEIIEIGTAVNTWRFS